MEGRGGGEWRKGLGKISGQCAGQKRETNNYYWTFGTPGPAQWGPREPAGGGLQMRRRCVDAMSLHKDEEHRERNVHFSI